MSYSCLGYIRRLCCKRRKEGEKGGGENLETHLTDV